MYRACVLACLVGLSACTYVYDPPPFAPMTAGAAAEQPGETCRDFTQTVMIGGKPTEASGRACQKADGSWRIVPPG